MVRKNMLWGTGEFSIFADWNPMMEYRIMKKEWATL